MMGILNSSLIKYSCNCLNPTVNIQPSDVQRLPYVNEKDVSLQEMEKVSSISKQNVSIKKELCSYPIIEPLFKRSPLQPTAEITSVATRYYNKESALLTIILLNQAIIDGLSYKIFGLSDKDKQMVLDKEGIPVGDLSVSHTAKQAYLAWLTSEENEFQPTPELLEHIHSLEENDEQPKIADFDTLYQNNNGWEGFCIKHKMNPIEVWWQFKNAKVLPPQRHRCLPLSLSLT